MAAAVHSAAGPKTLESSVPTDEVPSRLDSRSSQDAVRIGWRYRWLQDAHKAERRAASPELPGRTSCPAGAFAEDGCTKCRRKDHGARVAWQTSPRQVWAGRRSGFVTSATVTAGTETLLCVQSPAVEECVAATVATWRSSAEDQKSRTVSEVSGA
jgi:hypothetical protein